MTPLQNAARKGALKKEGNTPGGKKKRERSIITGMNPRVSPGFKFRPKWRGVIPLLIWDQFN